MLFEKNSLSLTLSLLHDSKSTCIQAQPVPQELVATTWRAPGLSVGTIQFLALAESVQEQDPLFTGDQQLGSQSH
jgi:hypothetical protein